MYTEIKKDIHWVGAVDWNERDFHGYNTPRGSTYNSYLIQDDKNLIVDAVKGPFADVLIDHVTEFISLDKIDYIIQNHAEPDHSGALPAMMKAMPNATLVCNKKTMAILASYYDTKDWKVKFVKTGDTLNIGKHTLTFMEIPLVHWPDSMATYLTDEKILFSNDAFGQHYATNKRFDDEVSLNTAIEEAGIYYANIVITYNKRVQQVLKSLKDLPIEMICPSHGIIWRSHVDEILTAYNNWAFNRCKAKIVVLYSTMWHSTESMAMAIVRGATRAGAEVKVFDLAKSNNTIIATELLDSAGFAVGTSTINQGMLSNMASAICYIQGMKLTDRVALAFGSYGWGKGGPEQLQDKIAEMKLEALTEQAFKVKYRPTPEDLTHCTELGTKLAEKTIALAAESGHQKLVTD
ncbi:MAG: FprA family A-type flavoprotein [Lentisphaeria bacterium]